MKRRGAAGKRRLVVMYSTPPWAAEAEAVSPDWVCLFPAAEAAGAAESEDWSSKDLKACSAGPGPDASGLSALQIWDCVSAFLNLLE